jgi:hypothetical protein
LAISAQNYAILGKNLSLLSKNGDHNIDPQYGSFSSQEFVGHDILVILSSFNV